MPNITRGGSTGRVLAYIIGKGRSGEHVNPHLVAGRAWAMFQKGGRTHSNRTGDARDLAAFIDAPMHEALLDGRLRKPPTRSVKEDGGKAVEGPVHVWHCSLALHPDEPTLGRPTRTSTRAPPRTSRNVGPAWIRRSMAARRLLRTVSRSAFGDALVAPSSRVCSRAVGYGHLGSATELDTRAGMAETSDTC